MSSELISGPILWDLTADYLADISLASKKVVVMYADDMLLIQCSWHDQAIHIFNQAFHKIVKWGKKNKLEHQIEVSYYANFLLHSAVLSLTPTREE